MAKKFRTPARAFKYSLNDDLLWLEDYWVMELECQILDMKHQNPVPHNDIKQLENLLKNAKAKRRKVENWYERMDKVYTEHVKKYPEIYEYIPKYTSKELMKLKIVRFCTRAVFECKDINVQIKHKSERKSFCDLESWAKYHLRSLRIKKTNLKRLDLNKLTDKALLTTTRDWETLECVWRVMTPEQRNAMTAAWNHTHRHHISTLEGVTEETWSRTPRHDVAAFNCVQNDAQLRTRIYFNSTLKPRPNDLAAMYLDVTLYEHIKTVLTARLAVVRRRIKEIEQMQQTGTQAKAA